ncbi:hypothetical protein SARC_08441 [Sphaeroforma arctica JP610]|uniref:Conserved oligomeric Golgi complex subunit 3 N-terminal domain-containing protein n=1 Tax=Sphaeroforma arctica JP610 TaxID=667725 RepID=A0A0L0FRI1_9EUKA|nr:hypothetical protein SARC_08441 [Sphaeroforma arctica JP610]KNC79161.1 hypothetical protein SARC_08441 [Sphaeroforma arctica JP610]|eukprot:XP_014153063.1 hypothetical protein SARC_08441 [Sphaeroforma arctica JP610]
MHKSLSYVKEHPDYVDSRTYLLKLQYQQNRALVLVKMHTVDLLKKATMEVCACMRACKISIVCSVSSQGNQ